MTARKTTRERGESELYRVVRELALRFPEAYEEFPWGHSAIKVRTKIFLTLVEDEQGLSMSLKLTGSNFEALLLPFTEPTHYGMGKHGWVTSRFGPGASAPVPLLHAWIEESFRAVAPKKLVALLDEQGPGQPAAKRPRAKRPAGPKAAAVTRRPGERRGSAAVGKPRRKKG